MIAFLSVLGVALADCSLELPVLKGEARWSGVIRTDDGTADCRRVPLGKVTEHRVTRLKGVVRQWDDSRVRFGGDRLVRVGEQWFIDLPEWREGDSLKLKLSLESSGLDESWSTPRHPLGSPDRVDVRWSAVGRPTFGEDGNVALRTTQAWRDLAAPGTYAVFSPVGAEVQECTSETATELVEESFGCLLTLKEGEVGDLSVSWREAGVGLSREWDVADAQRLTLLGATYISETDLGPDDVFVGPGHVVVHLTSVEGEPVEAVAIEEVETAAKLVSIPEPGLGLRFKGRQVDDQLVKDVLSLVQEQVQNGARVGGHPLKARPLMDVRRSGWATPWEQALLLSRYLGQMKLDARAFPVRPAAMGRAVVGAPEGYTHAVVRVETGGHSFWLDPACRACTPGEITPGLWGGQVFSSTRDALPAEPQSRR